MCKVALGTHMLWYPNDYKNKKGFPSAILKFKTCGNKHSKVNIDFE